MKLIKAIILRILNKGLSGMQERQQDNSYNDRKTSASDVLLMRHGLTGSEIVSKIWDISPSIKLRRK